MAQIKYVCKQCAKDFTLKYLFIKPRQVNCPHCGSTNVRENKKPDCGCSKSGRFT